MPFKCLIECQDKTGCICDVPSDPNGYFCENYETVLVNPYTGEPRDYQDVASDPYGQLIVEHKGVVRASRPKEVTEWRLTNEKINDVQVDTINALIPRCKAAHFVDVHVRINGKWEIHQADWLKHLTPVERPVVETLGQLADVLRPGLEALPLDNHWHQLSVRVKRNDGSLAVHSADLYREQEKENNKDAACIECGADRLTSCTERTGSGFNIPPTGEPCNLEDWNNGYEAGFADGKVAALNQQNAVHISNLSILLARENQWLEQDTDYDMSGLAQTLEWAIGQLKGK